MKDCFTGYVSVNDKYASPPRLQVAHRTVVRLVGHNCVCADLKLFRLSVRWCTASKLLNDSWVPFCVCYSHVLKHKNCRVIRTSTSLLAQRCNLTPMVRRLLVGVSMPFFGFSVCLAACWLYLIPCTRSWACFEPLFLFFFELIKTNPLNSQLANEPRAPTSPSFLLHFFVWIMKQKKTTVIQHIRNSHWYSCQKLGHHYWRPEFQLADSQDPVHFIMYRLESAQFWNSDGQHVISSFMLGYWTFVGL